MTGAWFSVNNSFFLHGDDNHLTYLKGLKRKIERGYRLKPENDIYWNNLNFKKQLNKTLTFVNT